MLIAVYSICIVAIYYAGYKFALYSSALYMEPEEIEEHSAKLSEFTRDGLNELFLHQRQIIRLSMFVKSFALVLLSFFAILIGQEFLYQYDINPAATIFISLLVVWILHVFLLEILPRRRAIREIDARTVRFLPFIALTYFAFKPFLQYYNRLFESDKNSKITEEQKEDIVERAIESLADQTGAGEPIVEEDEKEMIGQIFQLDVTEVKEVMVPRIDIIGVDKNASLEDVRTLAREAGYSRYPVYEDNPDKIIGMLYIKDVFHDPRSQSGSFEITNFMREPYYVPETKIISDLLADFKSNKIHIAIVLDEYGGTAGLVTLEDILEEIVGEIQDEYDSEIEPLLHMPDNSIQVDASVAVEKLLEEFNLDDENGEFETIGGLIYDLIGSVPSIGTKIRWNDIIFEVTEVEGQRIKSAKAWIKRSTDV